MSDRSCTDQESREIESTFEQLEHEGLIDYAKAVEAINEERTKSGLPELQPDLFSAIGSLFPYRMTAQRNIERATTQQVRDKWQKRLDRIEAAMNTVSDIQDEESGDSEGE